MGIALEHMSHFNPEDVEEGKESESEEAEMRKWANGRRIRLFGPREGEIKEEEIKEAGETKRESAGPIEMDDTKCPG